MNAPPAKLSRQRLEFFAALAAEDELSDTVADQLRRSEEVTVQMLVTV